MASSRVIIFSGAPRAEDLNWDSAALIDSFDSRCQHFLDGFPIGEQNVLSGPALTSTSKPSWRHLTLEREHLEAGFSQTHDHHLRPEEEALFLSTADFGSQESVLEYSFELNSSRKLSSLDGLQISQSSLPASFTRLLSYDTASTASDITSLYYEESFALHAGIPSSQLPVEKSDSFNTTSTIATTSTRSLSPSQSTTNQPPALPVPLTTHLSDLEDLPPAIYLLKIHPQTITLNLIVGIITISPPRTIHTRRGAQVYLIELLCGDETKSGFTVNFWLNSEVLIDTIEDGPNNQTDTERTLDSLRIQDIILLRNVALSSFQGKVYGQSLRKGMTKVDLLYRRKLDSKDIGGCYDDADLTSTADDMKNREDGPQVEKTNRVRDWVLRFVTVPGLPQMEAERGNGASEIGGKGRIKDKRTEKVEGPRRSIRQRVVKEVLPPDTQ